MANIRKIQIETGVSWRIDYYDPKGKRVMKRFRTRAAAEAYLGKVLSSKQEGRYDDIFEPKKESLVTLGELADKYTENFQHQKSFSRFKVNIIGVLLNSFGSKKLSQISYLDLETFRNNRKAIPTVARKTRSDARVNREMAVLKHMLNKAVEWDMLTVCPFKKGQSLIFKETGHRLRFLSEDEARALLLSCLPHLRPIVETALLTGMRKEEILSLRWEQYHHGLIHLEAKSTKSGKARQIPASQRLAKILAELRRKNQLRSPYIFCDPEGKRFGNVRKSFLSACRKAGITDFRFHDLRHTFAAHLVMEGANVRAVQELLGHADIKMTMRYAHLSPGHLKNTVELLDNLGTGKLLENFFQKRKEGDKP
jgi:integrase